jgi:hypothetical protein
LAAGGYVPLDPHASMDAYSSVDFKGTRYDLNCCYSKDANPGCGGSPGLGDFLLATGWHQVSSVRAGTVAIVRGSEGDFSHVVFGVSDNVVDAHNMAHYHTSFGNYDGQLLLDPPS